MRRHTTDILTQAAVHYLAKKMYSCHIELGVEAWGKKRMDILALNTNGDLIGIEAKSCVADYRADKKWQSYLQYANRFYFIFTQDLWEKPKFQQRVKEDIKGHGAGVIILCRLSGYARVVKNAKRRDVHPEIKQALIMKMAWRGGESRRTHKRRKRLYLEEAK